MLPILRFNVYLPLADLVTFYFQKYHRAKLQIIRPATAVGFELSVMLPLTGYSIFISSNQTLPPLFFGEAIPALIRTSLVPSGTVKSVLTSVQLVVPLI